MLGNQNPLESPRFNFRRRSSVSELMSLDFSGRFYEFYEFVSCRFEMSLHLSFTSFYEFRIGLFRLHNDPLYSSVHRLTSRDHEPGRIPASVLPGQGPPEDV